MYGVKELALIAATLIASFIFAWVWKLWQRSDEVRRRQEASGVLRTHGMEAHTYLPSFGAEDGELRKALTVFDYTNQIVLDSHGRVVGRVLPKAMQVSRGLRLVVDNTKAP